MGVLDKLSDAVSRFGPKKGAGGFSGGGIGNGHGMVPFDDNVSFLPIEFKRIRTSTRPPKRCTFRVFLDRLVSVHLRNRYALRPAAPGPIQAVVGRWGQRR